MPAFCNPIVFDQEFKAAYELEHSVKNAFSAVIAHIPQEHEHQTMSTVVQWLHHHVPHDIQHTLLRAWDIDAPHWGWENMSFAARVLAHGAPLDLFKDQEDVLDFYDVTSDLIGLRRWDLVCIILSQFQVEWLHSDLANPQTLCDFFETAEAEDQLEHVYAVLQNNFSFMWAAHILGGPMSHVQMVLDDPKFQQWSRTLDFFAGVFHQGVDTFNVYHHLTNNNLCDVLGVDQRLLAVRTCATILLTSEPSDTTQHVLARTVIRDETRGNADNVLFLEQLSQVIGQRTNWAGGTHHGDRNTYFQYLFEDFFTTFPWNTEILDGVTQSSAVLFNLEAFRCIPAVQSHILQRHIPTSPLGVTLKKM